MFKGTYIFKQDGKEIGRSENLVTKNGRKILLQYLAGVRNNWAADLAIGAIQSSPTVNDLELDFQTLRVPVSIKTYSEAINIDPDLIIVRATLPANVYANIYEVGIFPETQISNAAIRDNNILTDFSDLTNWYKAAGTVNISTFTPNSPDSPRIGANSVELTQSTIYKNDSVLFNLDNYTQLDSLQLLVHGTLSGNLTIEMTDSLGTSTSYNYTLTENLDYQVLSVPFNEYDKFLGTITSISISSRLKRASIFEK